MSSRSRFAAPRALLAALCLGALLHPACKSRQENPPAPALAPLPPALQALAAKLPNGSKRFPSHVARSRQHGQDFLELARQLQRPPLAAAAFHALALSVQQAPMRHALLGTEYRDAVASGLRQTDPEVLAAALAAGTAALAEPTLRDGLLPGVLTLAQQDSRPGTLLLVLESVLHPWASQLPSIRQLALDSLSADSAIVQVLSLEHLATLAWEPASPEASALHAKLRPLLEHPNPAVRGRALDVLAALPASNVPGSPVPSASLTDTDGFVRARACWALARLAPQSAPQLLRPLLSDTALCDTQVDGETLTGEVRRHTLQGSPLGEVRDAALGALQIVSRGSLRFPGARSKVSLDADVVVARAWLDSPPASPGPPSPSAVP